MKLRFSAPCDAARPCLLRVVAIAFLVIPLAGCERPPDEATVKAAVETTLRKQIPASWIDCGSWIDGRWNNKLDGQVRSIEIVENGHYNSEAHYWPRRVRVNGVCTGNWHSAQQPREFDRAGNFQLKRNDYGNWYALLDAF